jgi:dTDP-4-dehydrorhamnose reductase
MGLKYLITGANGQLAREFVKKLQFSGANYFAVSREKLDITDEASVRSCFSHIKPDVVLNCAAYNFVDKAETDGESAMRVNAEAPELLARAAEKNRAFLVHFGTDYVFDGAKGAPYTESDSPNPLNFYGASKLEGEKRVLQFCTRSLILRLSWVYGPGRQNFVHKFLNWAASSDILKISENEISVPTSADLAADITLKAVRDGLLGRCHLVNSGYCSRFEWAGEIARLRGLKKTLIPVPMADFGMSAKRPAFSAMSNAFVARELAVEIPPWQDSLAVFMRALPPDV